MRKIIVAFAVVFSFYSSANAQQLSFGIPANSLTASAGGAGTNGTALSLPSTDTPTISWNVSFSSAPSAVVVVLQSSLDGINFVTLDTSTVVAGESRSTSTAAPWIRARIESKTGGGNTTVSIVAKRGGGSGGSGGGAAGGLTNTELRASSVGVNCTAGCAGSGIQEPDDNSVAFAQTSGFNFNGNYVSNGATWQRLSFGQAVMASSLPVTIASNQTAIPVSGTFWQATQPVSLAVAPSTPVTNAGTFATQAAQSGTWVVTNPTAANFQSTADTEMPTPVSPTTNNLTTNAPPIITFNYCFDGVNYDPCPPDVGHNTADAGNPLKIGGWASAVAPAAVVNGNRVNGWWTQTGQLSVNPTAYQAGGCTPGVLISAATTNATVIKANPGQIYTIQVVNLNASPRYLKLYNKSTTPTVGTDTPVQNLSIPPNGTTGGGFVLPIPVGMEFTAGVSFAITAGMALLDSNPVAANEITLNYCWK